MKEGPVGGSWREGERIFSKDTRVYKTVGSWKLYLSKKEKCLIVDTTDYHPGLLYITRKDLEEILEALK